MRRPRIIWPHPAVSIVLATALLAASYLLIVKAANPAPAVPQGWHPCYGDPGGTSTPSVATLDAVDRLQKLADTIATTSADGKDPEDYRYSTVHRQFWIVVDGMVEPSEDTLWRAADGSGRTDERRLPARPDPDRFPDVAERQRLSAAPATTQTYPRPDGGVLAAAVAEPVPTNPAALADAIFDARETYCNNTLLFEAFVQLSQLHYLNRAARAAALRMLATVPGIAYDGIARDLLGRTGWSFTLTQPLTRRTIMLDPRTGRLLIATTSSSVTGTQQLCDYLLLLATDRTRTPGQPPDP
ncbi:hypothetical protein [Actinoplanes sp. NPDC020271]|uniref:hypothetical protein n=1 Tax=Actinoplanes sp. NPDC020271 TaxID=3363896 RepID=UPI00379D2519